MDVLLERTASSGFMGNHNLEIEIRGVAPLLMHRWPGDQPTAKKHSVRTQAIIDAMHRADWLRGAYWQEGTGFIVPGDVIDATIKHGARWSRKGKDFEAFGFTPEDTVPLLVFKDSTDTKGRHLNGRLEDFYTPEYIDLRGVVIKKVRVDRCRPIFQNWGLRFHYTYNDAFIQLSDVKEALSHGAMGDYRPRFGRFEVLQCKEVA